MRTRIPFVIIVGAGALTAIGAASPARAASRLPCLTPQQSGYGSGGDIAGVTTDGRLVRFALSRPGRPKTSAAITGLAEGERIVGIDTRPANGQLYALTTASALYVISPASAEARKVGTLSTPVSGGAFGVDWNPTVDRLRVVSDTGQNLRVNPMPDGSGVLATTVDKPLTAGSSIVAAAYTANQPGATSTVLYDIDASRDRLTIQQPPNDGTIVDVGPLGIDVGPATSFDISARYGAGILTTTVDGKTAVYRVDLKRGRARRLARPAGAPLVAATIVSAPVETLVALAGGQIVRVDRLRPSRILGAVTPTGPAASDTLVAIDFRPANGQLYGLGAAGQLYVLNVLTGASVAVGARLPLTGGQFGFDFNPTVDRLRVVSDSGQNLRVNPDTGAVAATDANLSQTGVSGAGYTNSTAGSTATVLFDVNTATDRLVRQDPPNEGTLVDVGPLGVDLPGPASFDIAEDQVAFVSAGRTLRCVNLRTGRAGNAFRVGVGSDIVGLAAAPRGAYRA